METIVCAQSLKYEVLTKSGSLTILKGVNLLLHKSQSLAIKGASGSGKSTLLALLAGLDFPQNGKIIFDGHDITQLSEDERASLRAENISFVFQDFHLIEDLNVLENVALPLELFGHKDVNKTAKYWLEKLGLRDRIKHFPKQLSGGEKQRVALSRAFAVKPRLIFADEPTANLDVKTASLVLDALFTLQKENNTSMVIATHDQTLAARCDHVCELEDGLLKQGGSDE